MLSIASLRNYSLILVAAALNPYMPARSLWAAPQQRPISDATATFDDSRSNTPPVAEKEKEAVPRPEAKKPASYQWQPLFDGKTLNGWDVPCYGGDGEVEVHDGQIKIGLGEMMTGIRYNKELPKINYELELEACRTDGLDFFCATTFPYRDSHCTLVVGGWAGCTLGLSCVDHYDASDNETTRFMVTSNDTWYRVRIRVSESKIESWVDPLDEKGNVVRPEEDKNVAKGMGLRDEKGRIVDLATDGKKISLRNECDLYKPLGITAWCSEGQIRKVQFRQLKPEEVKAIDEAKKQH